MNKILKNIFIFALVLVAFFWASKDSFAQTPPYSDDYLEVAVYVNDSPISSAAYTIKGNVYVNIDIIKTYGKDIFEFNTSTNRIYFNASKIEMDFGDESVNSFIKTNAGECYIPIKYFFKTNFVSIGAIARLAGISYRYEDYKLYLYPYSSNKDIMLTNSKAEVVTYGNGESLVLANGQELTIVSETTSFYIVQDAEDKKMYIAKDSVVQASQAADYSYNSTDKDTFSTYISMFWQDVPKKTTSIAPQSNYGIDVMSPTWMHQTVNGQGSVWHGCDYGYVQLCHEAGIKVWITANNDFMQDGAKATTTAVFSNSAYLYKLCAQYLLYACIYEADGICIDYEGLDYSNNRQTQREGLVSMIKTLSTYCNKLGITLSCTPFTNTAEFCKYIDYEALGRYCDYVIPQYYNERTSAAKGYGSTSSYGWYTYYFEKLTELVPANKILMGIPLYHIKWQTTSAGKTTLKGTITTATLLEQMGYHSYKTTWNDEDKQFVVTWEDSGSTYRIWVENDESIACKIAYGISEGFAGTACWDRAKITDAYLKVFEDIYRGGVDPSSFIDGIF